MVYVCEHCEGRGIEGGCPYCGFLPDPEPKMIDNVMYHFITNVGIDDEYHEQYRNCEARIVFEPAFDRFNQPIPSLVGVWVATGDHEKLPLAFFPFSELS